VENILYRIRAPAFHVDTSRQQKQERQDRGSRREGDMSGLTADDETYLRRAIALADAAVDSGSRPFGSVIVDADGEIVAEAYSTQQADSDWTAHAEMNALRAAGKKRSWDELAGCTLYASADPCPMCAGGVYWSNIRRVVFGVDAAATRSLRQGSRQAAGLRMSCREVLDRAPHPIAVLGPALVEEAIRPHRRFWTPELPT
jgi:tRNA(Arg) A34 adenosine deaminase TadA